MDRDPYSMIARLELLMESSSQGGRRGSEDVQSDTASRSGETVHSEVSSALQSTPQVRHLGGGGGQWVETGTGRGIVGESLVVWEEFYLFGGRRSSFLIVYPVHAHILVYYDQSVMV